MGAAVNILRLAFHGGQLDLEERISALEARAAANVLPSGERRRARMSRAGSSGSATAAPVAGDHAVSTPRPAASCPMHSRWLRAWRAPQNARKDALEFPPVVWMQYPSWRCVGSG